MRSNLPRTKRAVAILIASGVLTLAASSPAVSDTRWIRDPEDTPGRFDIIKLRHGHAQRAGVLWHEVKTAEPWRSFRMNGRSDITFEFTVDGEDEFDEYHVYFEFEGKELKAWMVPYNERSDGASIGHPPSRIEVRRPTRRRLRVYFHRDTLGGNVTRYGWSVWSIYKEADSRQCDNRPCDDFAPRGEGPDRLFHTF
ncbi:MAG: hypothetical protein ACRD1T_27760 [Acidimicrobiia bacterium]